MICDKCGANTEFGREFLFYGGRDLGDHKIKIQRGNTIYTSEIHNHYSDHTLYIDLCNRCLAKTDYMRTSDWVLGIGSILSMVVILPLLASKFPEWPSYWIILPSVAPFLIFILFFWIRELIIRSRIRTMNDPDLDHVIKTREASAYWQTHAHQKAISAYFAKTKTKVHKLNGMGWGIDDEVKNRGCELGYVYLASSEYKTETKVQPPPAIRPLTRTQRAQLDEPRMTQFYRDSAQAWATGRLYPFLKQNKKRAKTTADAVYELFTSEVGFQPAIGNALHYFFTACSPLPDEFLVTVAQYMLLTNKRLVIKHGEPASYAEIIMAAVAKVNLKDAKKGTLKLVMKSGEICILSDCEGFHPYLDKLVKRGVFTQ